MTRASSKRVSTGLAEFRDAVERLSRLYRRLRELIQKEEESRISKIHLDQEPAEEPTRIKVQRFSQGLTEFLKSRATLKAELKAIEKSIADLEKADSVDEISTLIGLTLLADHREYNHARSRCIKCYENEVHPVMPEISTVVIFADEMNQHGEWVAKLVNYDPTTGEDDFTKMIVAIRDHDLDRFNEIHSELTKRIEIEERH